MDHFYRFSEKESSNAMSQDTIGFKLEYLEAQSNLRFSLDLVTARLELPGKNSDDHNSGDVLACNIRATTCFRTASGSDQIIFHLRFFHLLFDGREAAPYSESHRL